MLVVSRKVDEKIVIGKEIVITLVAIRGDKVRIGVSAPKDTPILRQELVEATERRDDRTNDNGATTR